MKDNSLLKIKEIFDSFKQKHDSIAKSKPLIAVKSSEAMDQNSFTNNQIIAIGVFKAIFNSKLRSVKRTAFTVISDVYNNEKNLNK